MPREKRRPHNPRPPLLKTAEEPPHTSLPTKQHYFAPSLTPPIVMPGSEYRCHSRGTDGTSTKGYRQKKAIVSILSGRNPGGMLETFFSDLSSALNTEVLTEGDSADVGFGTVYIGQEAGSDTAAAISVDPVNPGTPLSCGRAAAPDPPGDSAAPWPVPGARSRAPIAAIHAACDSAPPVRSPA